LREDTPHAGMSAHFNWCGREDDDSLGASADRLLDNVRKAEAHNAKLG
jgi:hypothetical protein